MNPVKKSWLNWQLLALIAAVYALSFFLPAVSIPLRMGPTTVDGKVVKPGGEPLTPMRLSGADAFRMALEFGMAPLLLAGVAWFANPVFWLGGVLLALRKNLLAGIAGLLAVGLILVTYLLGELGSGDKATSFVGYWVWFSSTLLLSAVGFALWWRDTGSTEHSAQGPA